MPGHAIGAGTRNLSANVPERLHRAVGRLAVMRGHRSMGEFVRAVLEREVAQVQARGVELMRDARQTLMPWALCLVVACGFAATAIAAALGDTELRRARISRPLSVRVAAARRESRA
jgi:hypothetical protein